MRWLLLSAVMSLAGVGWSQAVPASTFATPKQSGGAPTLRTSSTLVVLPTLVRSEAGDLVHTLGASDFRVLDNGVEQHVSVVATERQPVAIVVLMQTGGDAARQFASYAGLGSMLEALVGSSAHQVALVSFDSRPESQWGFTPEIDDLKDGFLHPEAGDSGAAIFDAVSFGIDLLKSQPAGTQRILLLLSQPSDAGSEMREADLVRRLGENNVMVYSLSFSPAKTWLKDQFTKPRHGNPPYKYGADGPTLIYTFNLSEPLLVALKAMQANVAAAVATLSGGENFEFAGRHQLEQELSDVANHIPNRYLLTFQPSSAAPGYHTLAVTLPGRADLKVAARTSYWATPPTAR